MKTMKNLKQIWHSFSTYFSHLDIPSNHNVALIKSKGSGAHVPVTLLEFNDLCDGVDKDKIPVDLEKIQLHIASKGLQHSYRTFRYVHCCCMPNVLLDSYFFVHCRTSFWLDSFNACHLKCDRLDVKTSISGTPDIVTIVNQNRVANEVLCVGISILRCINLVLVLCIR